MGVRHPENVQHSLHGSIFAGNPVKRVEDDIRLRLDEPQRHFAIEVDLRDRMPAPLQRFGHAFPGH